MTTARPYCRRRKVTPHDEADFATGLSIKQTTVDSVEAGALPPMSTISVKGLLRHHTLQPIPGGSVQHLLLKMRGVDPAPRVNLTMAHMEPYGVADPVAEATRQFEQRAAAAVFASAGIDFAFKGSTDVIDRFGPRVLPRNEWESPGPGLPKVPRNVDLGTLGRHLCSPRDLLEMKWYGDAAPTIHVVRAKCLALMAYPDFFPAARWQDPNDRKDLRLLVSEAILSASAGWCGTFGPGVAEVDLLSKWPEGNYDMQQMRLLPLAYRFYDELTTEAREHLIGVLLADGRVHRVGLNVHVTSGRVPADWRRAGFVRPSITIQESENHILMILTTRYLTNQLLYQRGHDITHDNRRNGGPVVGPGAQVEVHPHCTELVLTLLQRILNGDFAEYNAKPYQAETRAALLNLCSYAYDHEVRLAARMVLDYISAHIAVSSNDLRRLVPFRRKNEGDYASHTAEGFMTIGLVETERGADPMSLSFAMQAGNTRAYEYPYRGVPKRDRRWAWSIAGDGDNMVLEALSDYRLPPSIHDLFVSDSHRRFFQRLHRVPHPEEVASGRNCDNMEIYAGSPSYLISAGGSPAVHAIDPRVAGFTVGDQAQQVGVAVTTSFMPTGKGARVSINDADEIIQLSHFSDMFSPPIGGRAGFGATNYGVAPDFACGHKLHLPHWCAAAIDSGQDFGKFSFVDRGSGPQGPGFYLALLRDGDMTVMEAWDTWLHPGLTFDAFKDGVFKANKDLSDAGLKSNVEATYTTQSGNRIHFVIWNDDSSPRDFALYGAKVLSIAYSDANSVDAKGQAERVSGQFLNGTVMNSPAAATVEISNHFLEQTITLDMHDMWRPRRISETGEVEEAGANHEVWVDFEWTGQEEGDFFRPFKTIGAAMAAVADHGVIQIMPGSTREKPSFHTNRRIRLAAWNGGVTIGAA